MKSNSNNLLVACVAGLFLFIAGKTAVADPADMYSGYFYRDSDDDRVAKITGKELFLKFYPDQRVVMLYIPYPYSKSLQAETIHQVFSEVIATVKTEAYTRGEFSLLEQDALAQVEFYTSMDGGQYRFECNGTAPCRVKFADDSLEMRKAGMLNDHIIKFNRAKD